MDVKTLEEKFLGKKFFEGDMAPRDMMSFIRSDVQKFSESFRILGPGDPMTKDYRMDRVNIFLDENRICKQVSMG